MTKPGRNDPCPCGSGKKYKHCHLGKPDDAWSHPAPVASDSSFPGLSDYRFPPDDIADIAYADETETLDRDDELDDHLPVPTFTKLDEAWDLVELAWSEADPKKAKLAREALQHSLDCCGAYFILAILEPKPAARLEMLDQAIAAADRAVAPLTVAGLAQFEWTEPDVEYALYAMQHRALALTELERDDEAIELYRRLLELDPSDRLDARLPLFLQLMGSDELDAAAEVDRGSTVASESDATWAYARALLKFQREGDSVFARRALSEAIILYPEETEVMHKAFTEMAALDMDGTDALDYDNGAFDIDQTLLDELAHLSGVDGERVDPVSDLHSLFCIGIHALLWQTTDGAGAWFERVLTAGPSIRYDNGMLGDGPLLTITPSKQEHYRHCPNCRKQTKFRPVDLVLQLEDGRVVDLEVNARNCPACEIVCIAFEDIARQIVLKHSDGVGYDFMPLGFIADTERQENADAECLLRHLRPWRKIEDADTDRLDWPTLEEQIAEVDDLLKKAGLAGLLGPLPRR